MASVILGWWSPSPEQCKVWVWSKIEAFLFYFLVKNIIKMTFMKKCME